MKVVYALQLMNNKFYVGSTYNFHETMKYIFSKNTKKDQWLMHNKPLYVVKVVHNCKPEEEYKCLLKYIREYGVDNVRGPSFDAFTHEQETLREITEKINLSEM